MEVLLKAKQAGNAQFGFLSFDNELHAYYKLLLTAIRAGRYKPRDPQNNGKHIPIFTMYIQDLLPFLMVKEKLFRFHIHSVFFKYLKKYVANKKVKRDSFMNMVNKL